MRDHVNDALARENRRHALAELVGELEAEHGPLAPEELAEARRRWLG